MNKVVEIRRSLETLGISTQDAEPGELGWIVPPQIGEPENRSMFGI
jgi:hypothetical protein